MCKGKTMLSPLSLCRTIGFTIWFVIIPCLIGCFYNGEVLTNGQSIPDPGNMCSECTCQVASPYKHPPVCSGRLTSLDNVSYLFSHRVVQCDVQRGRVRQPSVLTQAPTPVAALSVMVTSLKHVTLQIMWSK